MVAKILVFAVAAFVIWQFVVPLLHSHSTSNASGAPTTATTGAPDGTCPSPAAASLPGQRGSLVVRYQTTKHLITLCTAVNGQLYYDGQIKGEAPSADSHISLPARPTSDGYEAVNGVYTYTIKSGRIVVKKSGTVLLDERLQPA